MITMIHWSGREKEVEVEDVVGEDFISQGYSILVYKHTPLAGTCLTCGGVAESGYVECPVCSCNIKFRNCDCQSEREDTEKLLSHLREEHNISVSASDIHFRELARAL